MQKHLLLFLILSVASSLVYASPRSSHTIALTNTTTQWVKVFIGQRNERPTVYLASGAHTYTDPPDYPYPVAACLMAMDRANRCMGEVVFCPTTSPHRVVISANDSDKTEALHLECDA